MIVGSPFPLSVCPCKKMPWELPACPIGRRWLSKSHFFFADGEDK